MHCTYTRRHRSVRLVSGLIVVLLASVPGLAAEDRSPIPDRQLRDETLGVDHERPSVWSPGAGAEAATGAQDDFDVTHYLIDIDFDDTTESIDGRVTVTATSLVDGLQLFEFDLLDNMTVSNVTVNAFGQAFTHQNDVVAVTVGQPVDSGNSITMTIHYSGSPEAGGLGSFGWNKYGSNGQGEMVWSLSEPEGARAWWPSKDRPDDKALVEEWWTVKPGWTATGNGKLLAVDTLGNGRKRYRWKATHPLTSYLVSVAATDYVTFFDSYTPLAGGSMPIDYYVYPEDLLDAQVSFSETEAMLEFFAETFGEYPFVEDKYGMSAFPFGGAMEHSTNTSYGYFLIDGTNTYDFINAHEIAHQWFGDAVSPETWRDIWLNEGFASYGEALWTEHLSGGSGYRQYMNTLFREFFAGPVYDPNSLFSSTVYNKGAWVLHMLRGVIGDEPFFEALREWYETRKHGNGNTAQLQAELESFHGGSLDWFFQQWVYGTSRPAYEYGYATADLGNGTFRNYVRITQVQPGAGTFVMPVDLALRTASGTQSVEVWNDLPDQDFVLDTPEPLIGLDLDELDWILKGIVTQIGLPDADSDGVPDRNDNCPAEVNPAQADLDGDLLGDACDPDDDGDLLDDTADCAPLDPEQGLPPEVDQLTVTSSGNGSATLAWTPVPRADSYDVTRGLVSLLSQGYGSCFAPGIPGLTLDDDAEPPPGDGYHYLVRGHDAGCGGGGSLGQDSANGPRPSPCP